MFGPQLFVLPPQFSRLAQFERQAQGIERSSPLLTVGKRPAEDRQAVGFQVAIACPLVSDVSGRRGAIEQQSLFTVIARLDLQNGTSEPQPAGRIIRRDRYELAENQHACAEVILLEGGIGVPAQCRGRLTHRASIAFDLRFELDGRFIKLALLEGLFGRQRGSQGKGQERGGKAGANDAKHGKRPPKAADCGRHDFSSRWCRARGSGAAMPEISMPWPCPN